MEQLKHTRVLAASAMLLAIATVMGFFKVPVTQFIELRFAYLPIACAGYLFGPGIGAAVGAMSDILGYLVKPTGPYFPGFTLTSAVGGLIYALWLHKRPLTLRRAVCAQLTHVIFVSFLLNPLWLSLLYGRGFLAVVTARVVKNVIMFPIDTGILYLVLSRAGALWQKQVRD